MIRRKTKRPPVGPSLLGEQVSELWVWVWSGVNERTDPALAGTLSQRMSWELDEGERLLVALDRAIDRNPSTFDYESSRYQRDQGPHSAARLFHYLVTKIERCSAATLDKAEGQARLGVLTGALELLLSLLQQDPDQMRQHCSRLEVGDAWANSTLFRDSEHGGVILESKSEGPVPASEAKARKKLADAAYQATWRRPRKLRGQAGGAA